MVEDSLQGHQMAHNLSIRDPETNLPVGSFLGSSGNDGIYVGARFGTQPFDPVSVCEPYPQSPQTAPPVDG